jgi:hypothetical protein
MAKNTQLSREVTNAQANVMASLADGGYLRIYTGSQPVDGNANIGGVSQLLAELRLSPTAFGKAVSGTSTANPIQPETYARTTGTATWFRVVKSDGVTPLWDGSVGTEDANLVLNSTAVQLGATVAVTSFSYTVHRSTSGY